MPKTNTSEIPLSVKHFDELPASARVNVKVVASVFGYSVATVWRRVERGLLPQPRKDGSCTRWNVGELRKILQGEPA